MCQGLGPKKHDEISEIDRIDQAASKSTELKEQIQEPRATQRYSVYVYVYVYVYVCIYIYIYIHIHILSGSWKHLGVFVV